MAEQACPAVSVVVDQVFDHPEGLVWDARQGRLLWVDIFAGLVLSHDLASAPVRTWDIGRAVGAVAPRRGDGGLVCAVREGFGFLGAQGEFSLVTDQLRDQPYLQMNDGAVDARGRFWAGTTCLEPEAYPGAGHLYCLDPVTLQATEQLSDIDVSNGIGWSPDGRRCYYIDSARRRIDVYPFDADSGEPLGERGTLAEVDAVPDGLAVDSLGCIWVALCGGWEVHRFTPAGRLDRVVRLPGSLVTTCCFGGPDLGTLFIAVSAHGLDDSSLSTEKAGYIFALDPGVQGLPAPEFLG
ncbi:MAG TPA: SMP-30/gluconolactonase/LRE family protein [Acidimicrobiales bacterium]|nr:SMP-30/gluconolactonase/LRE family protein [Acidimicrobiales bacterium]